MIGLEESRKQLAGDDVILLRSDTIHPLCRVDPLQHQTGRSADPAILVREQMPQSIDWRLDVGTNQRFACTAANDGLAVLQALDEDRLAARKRIEADEVDGMGGDEGVVVVPR